MCSVTSLSVDIVALREGETVVRGQLGDEFFAAAGGDVRQGDVRVEASIRKGHHFSDITLRATGTVAVTCDRCLELIDMPVSVEQAMTVSLGETRDDDEGRITVTHAEPTVDLAWLAYEAVTLSLPVKRVHAPGKCNPAMIKLLSEHNAARSGDTADEKTTTDPRWAALAQLGQ